VHSDEDIAFAKQWIKFAQKDLLSAQKLLLPPDTQLEACVYHCQQAAEKAVKALLALHGRDIPMKHDIGLLISAARGIDVDLQRFLADASTITEYAVDYRYPMFDVEALKLQEVEYAMKYATDLVDLIQRTISGAS